MFKENNTSVMVDPQPGETVLFFCIDDKSKGHSDCGNCQLRNDLLGKQQGQRICDLLIFYAKGDRRVLCFAELKDNKSDLGDATVQVTNTYNAKLKLTNHYTIQAFLIGHHGSAPSRHDIHQKNLSKIFKNNNYIYNGKPDEFADFFER